MVSLWRLSAQNLGAGGQWEYRGIRYTRLKQFFSLLHAKSAPECKIMRRVASVVLKTLARAAFSAYVHTRPARPRATACDIQTTLKGF